MTADALQSAAGPKDGAYPLDILGAESEGMIDYPIEQELGNLLADGALLATLLTAICRLEDAAAILRGDAGTKIEAGGADIQIRR